MPARALFHTLLYPSTDLLVTSTAAVALTTAAFLVVALLMHARHRHAARRRLALEARWEPVLLRLMDGELDAPDFWRQVDPRDYPYLLDYLLRYAFVVRGESRRRLDALARPFIRRTVRRLARRSPEKRAHAVHTLGAFGLHQHGAVLVNALSDPSDYVALTAARALAASPHPRHAEALLAALDRFRALGPHVNATLLSGVAPSLVPLLVRLFADAARPVHTRIAAADALRWAGSPEAAEVARAVLFVETDRDVRAASLRLLRAVGTDAHADVARFLAEDEDDVVRMHALTALARVGTDDDARYLEAALADTSRWVSLRAARGLREMRAHHVLHRVARLDDHAGADVARQTLAE